MLQGCGGGSGGSGVSATITPVSAAVTPGPVPLTPLFIQPEPISTHGVVSALGSIRVNGVTYDTGNATISVNGGWGSVSDLKLGHIVTLIGEINTDGSTGTASSIEQNATIIGPVGSIDLAARRLVVMGQMVLVDQTTLFHSSIDADSFDGLQVGGLVQISGFAMASGEIRATLIEPAAADSVYQVAGIVSAMDQANGLFKISQLIVDYDNAESIQLPNLLQNGSYVMVTGSLADGILIGDQVSAAFDADFLGTSGRRFLIEGTIGRFAANLFQLNGWSISIDVDTQFLGGIFDDLLSGSFVVVDGKAASGGNSILADFVTLGNIVKETTVVDFDLEGFTEISVSSVFKVHVIQDT
jgi:hypothetical protein|tara:strand:+ start:12212 stop:13279 length:1068 start_codon:yes stop_codon:yes gene_type:complete